MNSTGPVEESDNTFSHGVDDELGQINNPERYN
jgi:hypothetical protein